MSLAKPWWTWASEDGDREVWQAVRNVGSKVESGPARCPFCLIIRNRTVEGRFKPHEDTAEKCRGSGISLYVALMIFQGMLGRKDVEWLIRSIQAGQPADPLPDEERPFDSPEDAVRPYMERLKVQRIGAGLSVRQIAEAIGRSRPSLQNYETLMRLPTVNTMIDWAGHLGFDLSLVDGQVGGFHWPLSKFRDAAAQLMGIRIRHGLTLEELAEMGGQARAKTLMDRESGKVGDIQLATLIEWARLLGYDLELTPKSHFVPEEDEEL